MSFLSRFKQTGKKVAASLAAVTTAGALMVAGAGSAEAAHRDWLRPDSTGTCDWDGVGFWVQRCDVFSQAMNKNITVQIQPAARGGNAALYLLDGARATNVASAWTVDTNAPAKFVDNNITLVMPVGGAGSFYTDWAGPSSMLSSGDVFKWETFLTQELPPYLEQHFGVARNNNSVAGLSMGATAALNLAATHPGQFRQALSYSGYLQTSTPMMQLMMGLALLDVGGLNINSMYGAFTSQRRQELDPYLNMAGLAGKDVYISAASGTPGPADIAAFNSFDLFNGTVLEWISKSSTRTWEAKARSQGLNVTSDYPIHGVHNWLQWNYQLDRTHDRILNVMNAW